MNPKRLVVTILVLFVVVWVTDFLIHGVWLQSAYKETMSLWRSEADMRQHMHWLMLGQLLAAAMFTVLWAKGFAAGASLARAGLYGLCLGMFGQAATLITFAVQPLPRDVAIKWFASGIVQGVVFGLIVFVVYKPRTAEAKA